MLLFSSLRSPKYVSCVVYRNLVELLGTRLPSSPFPYRTLPVRSLNSLSLSLSLSPSEDVCVTFAPAPIDVHRHHYPLKKKQNALHFLAVVKTPIRSTLHRDIAWIQNRPHSPTSSLILLRCLGGVVTPALLPPIAASLLSSGDEVFFVAWCGVPIHLVALFRTSQRRSRTIPRSLSTTCLLLLAAGPSICRHLARPLQLVRHPGFLGKAAHSPRPGVAVVGRALTTRTPHNLPHRHRRANKPLAPPPRSEATWR